jgi:hypothetical protein
LRARDRSNRTYGWNGNGKAVSATPRPLFAGDQPGPYADAIEDRFDLGPARAVEQR